MFGRGTCFLLSLLLFSQITFAADQKREETEDRIQFEFFGEKFKLNKVFNIDREFLNKKKYIPLATKLAKMIYTEKDLDIRLESGVFLSYVLYTIDMKIAAIHVLQSILIHKAQSFIVPQAFKLMVLLIAELNNDYIVSNFFKSIDTTKLSNDNRTALNYYYAKAVFKENKLESAAKIFRGINKEHHEGKYYYLSRYYLATIEYLRDHKQRAIPYLDEIFSAENEIPMELKAQSRLLAGRIYSDINKLDVSIFHYELVPYKSLTWDQALLEVAWVYLRKEQYEKVVGRTHSLNSPFFYMYYFPDGYIIEALGYMKLCQFGKVKSALDSFEQKYRSYLPKLRAFKGGYLELALRKNLPPQVVKTFARNSTFISLHRGIQQIHFEKERAERFTDPTQRSETFAKYSKKFYNYISEKYLKMEKHHVRSLDRYLKIETKDLAKKLKRLYLKYEFIRFEMYAQAKQYLQTALATPNKIQLTDDERHESSYNRLYIWKFDNEYWLDELPYYEYAGINICKK